MSRFDLESYATVQQRVEQFYQDFPDGSMRTFMRRSEGPEVVFETRVYRNVAEAEAGVYTSGWAREVEGKTPVNRTSHLENCESSSVGRALAHLGYATDARRPSRAEMIKVARVREEHEQMLRYVREHAPRLEAEAVITLDGEQCELRQFVRENWASIRERHAVAHAVVDAIEMATGVIYAETQAEAEAA